MEKKGLVWLRRDLRLHDHGALSAAIQEMDILYLVFVFDPTFLDPLRAQGARDRRIHFIAESLLAIAQQLEAYSLGLCILEGDPVHEIPTFVRAHNISNLYFNRDYTPYAKGRDNKIKSILKDQGVGVATFKDHVRFESDEVLKKDQTAYRVFTPYARQWRSCLEQESHGLDERVCDLSQVRPNPMPSPSNLSQILSQIQFQPYPAYLKGGTQEARSALNKFSSFINAYHQDRDYPALDHTSHLSVYIRHGCISIREILNFALDSYPSEGAFVWVNELIWRDFYQMVLAQFPHVVTAPFNSKFNEFIYPGDPQHYHAWCQGKTGYPIIDAAMRCLNETGWMHNRLRMITASFFCKLLLLDWRKGEAYFARHLLDYDLASNNGGWQWSSGTGCDAAPYYRIFNPYTQSRKFDSSGTFIRKYCPELAHLDSKQIHTPVSLPTYSRPIIDYRSQREQSLLSYQLLK